MKHVEDLPLKPYNTFRISAFAKAAFFVQSVDDLRVVLRQQSPPFFILGGGSNILLTRDVEEPLIINEITGIEIISESDKDLEIAVGAGVVWHELVEWTLERNYGGLENLSLIPGKTGAAPMQNIGAYGVEIQSVLTKVEALKISDGTLRVFTNAQCQFGYRESIFKQALRNQYIITRVYFRLQKAPHTVNLSYRPVQDWMTERGIHQPTIQQVSAAVIAIRESKLPDPNEIGNGGSFFKNPELSPVDFQRLQTKFPQVPHYPLPDGRTKVPAGWLIDQAGWKGYRAGDAGVHPKQALVLVNYGKASGSEILNLSYQIQSSVLLKFGVALQREINVY